jgi:hypothetical protein
VDKIATSVGFQKDDDMIETLKEGSIFSDIMQEHWRHLLSEVRYYLPLKSLHFPLNFRKYYFLPPGDRPYEGLVTIVGYIRSISGSL